MKIGLLARADTSGLGVQTYEFWRHMQPAKTLVIAAHWNSLLPVNPAMYPGAEVHPRIGMGLPARPDPVLDAFLDGLDLVFTAETPYNYWLWTRARERGVKTVQQFNYEFLFPDPAIPQPTLYAAPSLWHFDDVPFANRCYLPVPVARDRLPFRQRTELRTLLHTVGIPTDEDRNGTRIAMEAMQHVPRDLPVRLRVRTQDRGKLPPPMDDRVEMVVERIPNYWDVYQDEDAFVMPRKFGGLCLAVGSLVTTPTGREPIENLSVGDEVVDGAGTTTVTGIARRQVQEVIEIRLRGTEIVSSLDHLHLISKTHDGDLFEARAGHVRHGDWMFVAQPSPDGIQTVEVGPRPKRQGLIHWKERVELDRGWARLIGLFLAEGSRGMYSRRDRATNKTAQICWHFGGGEKHFAEEVAGLLRERGLNPFVTELFCANATFGPSTTWTVRCRSMWLYELFDRLGIGRGAKGKRAPDLSVALVPDLVGGWLDGDGSAHAGGIRGYSESRLMVRDMWRLLAKAGILGAVDNDGRCLNISMQSDAKTVAGWTKRLRINRLYKQSPRISRDWRRVDLGWMVRVKHIARVKRATNVASIETVSGRYIANDVLTHNCLGVNEAASLGMPILMPAIDPQVRFLPGRTLIPPRTPPRKIQVMNPIHLYETYPHELAARIAELARRPEEVAALSRASDRYAESISWDRLKPLYVSTFERVCNGERLGVAA